VEFREFFESGIKRDWLDLTKRYFPNGRYEEPFYIGEDSRRRIYIKFDDSSGVKIYFEFSWLDRVDKSVKDKVAPGYHSGIKMEFDSLDFMKKLRSYFEGVRKLGISIAISPSDNSSNISRRGRLFGKILRGSGFDLTGTEDNNDGRYFIYNAPS